jgi:CelD/BcsL family acetyltransferase involved in cellulose biosynthesis
MLVSNWTLMECSLNRPDAAVASEWRILLGRSLVPSGNNLPELLMPALERMPGAIVAQVRDSAGLQLALPLHTPRFPRGFHSTLSTPVSFFGLPHLGRDTGSAALQALLRKVDGPLLMHSVPVDGELWKAIEEASGHVDVLATWDRAVLRPRSTFAEWFDTNFERKRRKEYRRLQARLAEQGQFEAFDLRPGDAPAAWIDDLLKLEAAGWKGQRGTALMANSAVVATLHEAAKGLAEAGRLRFWKLALDGRPIAMMYAVVDGSEAWLGKIAFDETWAKYSPGVLLILHATERIFAEGITQADSCAIPDHPMINHLWRDRLKVADVMIAAPTVSGSRFRFTVMAERLRHKLRSTARDIFYKVTGRHRS